MGRLEAEDRGEILDLEGAVAFLKVSKPTFYRWLAQGKIQGFKAGRQWRFYRRNLIKFLEYDEPTTAGIDVKVVEEAIRVLEEGIQRTRRAKKSKEGRKK